MCKREGNLSPINQGSELADHQRFTMATDIEVYFCDPSSQWQCGSNIRMS